MANRPTHLPSISTLVNTSLNIFTQKLRPLTLWTIISIVSYVIAFIILVAVTLITGAQVLPLFRSGFHPQALGSALTAILLLLIVLIVVFGIAGAVSQAGYILIITTPFKTGYKNLLRKSFSLVIPLFVVGILTTVILLGSFLVLIIPALIFSFLFSFAAYEVVIQDVRGLQAIRNSTRIILDNFWGILGRILLLWVVAFLAYYGVFAFIHAQHFSSFFTIAYILFRILFVWFTTVYSIILYKEARAAADLKKPAPMVIIWVITILGWLAIAVLVFTIGRFVVKGGLQQLQKDFQQSSPYAQAPVNTTQKQLLKSQALLNQIRSVATNEQEPQRTEKIKSLNDQNINGLKQALLKDPNNEQLWQVLCVSYQLPNTVGTTAEKNLACSKTTLPTPTQSQ